MALPIAHAGAGWLIYIFDARSLQRRGWTTLLFYIVCANAPDFDFLPGLLIDHPGLYHRGPSHSMVAALLFSLGLSLFYVWRRKEGFARNFAVFLTLYLSHLVLDLFTVDTRLWGGIPLLWPFSSRYYQGPLNLFPEVPWSGSSTWLFFASLLQPEAFWMAGREALLFFLFGLCAKGILWRQRPVIPWSALKRANASREGQCPGN